MQVVLNKNFETLPVDFYENNNSIYLTRKQIGDALEYKDEKSIARLISRNKEKIGNGIPVTVSQKEGDRTVTREVEAFSTKQVIKIISCSKTPKANAFMDFILETVEQLFSGKAELKFHNPEDEKTYLKSVRNLVGICTGVGISKLAATTMLVEAKINGTDPNVAVLSALQDKVKLENSKRRGAVKLRVWYVAEMYFGNNSEINKFEEVWHVISSKLKFYIGVDLQAMRQKLKDHGVARKDLPSYLDYFEQYDCWDAVDKVLKQMLKEAAKTKKDIPQSTTA